MIRRDNYAIMADQTRQLFLTYDQSAIVSNIPLRADSHFFYLPVLDRICRIDRQTGHLFWSCPDGSWQKSSLPNDFITIFDYLCDAKPHRRLSGQFCSQSGLGSMVHTGLNENGPATPLETFIDSHPEEFRSACEKLNGTPVSRGDISFLLPLFPDLPVLAQFWHSDEDFPPQLRFFWDTGTLSYLRYETTYYALGLIRSRLSAFMNLPK